MKIDRVRVTGSDRFWDVDVRGVGPRTFRLVGSLLIGTILFFATAQGASALTTAEQLESMSVTESFNGGTESLANFGSKWSTLGWAGGGTPKGSDTTTGWRPVDAYSAVNGAFYNTTIADTGPGIASVATMAVNPSSASRYFSIWLDTPTPASTKAGYELRFTNISTGTYEVKLSKWISGTQTVLASKSSYSFSNGNSFALVDQGGTVSAWTNTGAGFSQLLSASDTTFEGGSAAVEGSGNITRLTNFKVGVLSTTAEQLESMSVTESFNGGTESLANFGSKWSTLGWAGGGTPKGSDTTTGWRPVDAYSAVNGAFYNTTIADTGPGIASVATMAVNPSSASRYFSIWLDTPTPASTKAGYELRFTNISTGTYEVKLSKWISGTQTVLASKSSYSFSNGNSFALVDQGGTVSAWTNTGAGFSQLLSASDTTFEGGSAAVEGSGNITRLTNFKVGVLGHASPDTTISGGPKGVVIPNVSFSFTATEGGSSFECSLDGASYSACASPKAYQGLSEGSHAFRVRATGAGGTDETPAERSFQVVQTAKATTKVSILDNLERSEVPLENSKWSKSSWAGEIGGAWMGGYRGYGSNGGDAGAYWNPTSFSDGEETDLVSGSVGTGAAPEGQYLALWLDMPNPGSARSGYEARFTGVNGSASNYKVELSKWVSGARTVLASTSGFSLAVGTTMTLTETAGGSLALWTGTSTMTSVLSASDSTYTSGYAGLEVNGGAGTIYNFRAGRIDIQPPDTTIQSGPTGAVLPENISFTFSSTESGSSFECSLDGASYSACASPKAYPGLTSGSSHTFRVRAVDAVGNQDETPAERNFSVIQPPTVVTNAATGVKAHEATLNANVNPNGGETTYQFEYGTTTSYGSKAPASPKGIGSGAQSIEVSNEISGLQPGTTYHFRVSATNGAGTSHGEDQTFTTPGVPVVATEAPSNVSAHEATFNASVNPTGAATSYQFEYGKTTAYGSKIPAAAKSVGSGISAVSVSEAPNALEEDVTYHYRAVAENEAGTTYGEDEAFKTPLMPDVETEAAEAVEGEEAVLSGSVDPNGAATEYDFEYGTTAAYGTTIPPDEAGNGNGAIEAREAIGELQPETTYHYRIVAASQAGTDYGKDMTLTTGAASNSVGETPLPGDFFGMMWTGSLTQTGYPNVLSAVKKSGARVLRLVLNKDESLQPQYESIFRQASHRGLTILPYIGDGKWPTDSGEQNAWKEFARKMVVKYGPGGSFWNGAGHPITAWEIWNEPNLPTNSPFPDPSPAEIENDPNAPYKKIGAEQFGNFFHKVAEGLKEGAGGHHIEILAPGLFGFGSTNCEGGACHLSPANFLSQMGHTSDYEAVSLHPYVFKVKGQDGKPHAPTGPNQVAEVMEKVENYIRGVRDELKTLKEPSKKIWVTEGGFPVKYACENPAFPGVTEDVQREEIEATFGMMKAKRDSLDIGHAIYYNIQDYRDAQGHEVNECEGHNQTAWAYHSGLRKGAGGNRKGWRGFTSVTPLGKPDWSSAKKPKNTRNNRKALSASASYDIETEGAQYEAQVEWGKGPLSSEYPQATGWQKVPIPEEGEGEEEALEVEESTTLAKLEPSTKYHYRVAVRDENGDVERETTGHEFETKPLVTASIRALNGELGWVNITGHVESETPLNNTWVNINFKKYENGEWIFNTKKSTHAELYDGDYSLVNLEVGKGKWEANVVFEGSAEAPQAETGLEEFTIKNAYHLVAQNSGKCLEVSYGSSENGMSIHQEPCGDGHTQQAQAFTLVPSPSNPAQYEIVNRNSGKCLDVKDASQSDGAQIQQYTCLGWGQANQIFEGVPVSSSDTSHVKYIAQHSHKCLDITGASTADGALLQQWSCNGGSNQAFGFESVEADPVPTTAHVTLDETLYGHPGYETLHGSVEAPQSVAGQYVNVNFKKKNSSGVYEYVERIEPPPTLNSEGKFSYSYWGVGAGEWEVVVVYPGFGVLAESKTPEEAHRFHVGDGYRFEFRQSNKCVSTSGGGTSNGTAIIQWDCDGNYNPSDGQVYSVKPMAPAGSNYFEVIPDSNTNMCLDVTGGPGATQNGATVQLWQCLGESQTNQIWHIVELASPNQGWFSSIAKHSGRCMTVSENSTANGAGFLQWDCSYAGSQQWRWLPVG